MFSRILMPVAFSARCHGAARFAEALATHFHSELVLLHVVMPIPAYSFQDGMPLPSGVMDDMVAQGKAQLETFAEQSLKGIPVTQVVLAGDPAQQIVDYANAGKVDLIIMPTHGYGPFRRFLLGSVTAKVLHDASCPVWTGPHMENAPPYPAIHFRKILCAVDLSIDSRAILQWAANFAREYSAHLAVVHAVPSSSMDPATVCFDPEWSILAKKQAHERLAFMGGELGITGEIAVETGDAPEAVRAFAENSAADLLVIGRGRATGSPGRLRTNAYAILREAPCPVVVI
jgi:nucleotide-binding universal stress UspA family protein